MKNLAIFILLPGIYTAQVKTELEVFNNSRGSVFDVTNTNFKSYEGIDGSPYFSETFSPIKIEGYNKFLPNLRYNAYEDEMEFKADNVLNYVVKAGEMSIYFTDLNKTYVLKKYTLDGKPINGYLVELVEGKKGISLLKKESKHIVEYNNNTTNTYLKEKNPAFQAVKDILIISIGENYYRIPKNLKELKSLSEQNNIDINKVEDFVRKNKINFNREKDLVTLINYINS